MFRGLAGPASRAVLQALADIDVSNGAFRFLDCREMAVAGVPATVHIGVGRHGSVVNDFVRKLGVGAVVLGTRGHTGLAGVLMGSVAQDVIAHVEVPVTLVK